MNPIPSYPMAPTRTRQRNNISAKKPKWTPEEDSLLAQYALNNEKVNWNELSRNFPGKSSQQVFERWTKVLDPKLLKGSWSRNEDEIIIQFVQKFGTKSWTKLAEKLPGRIGKQCRERWINHLDPSVEHGPWTAEEDKLLMELHQKYGNHWVKIASMMPHRSDNSIKNRWNSTLCKRSPADVVPTTPIQKTVHFIPKSADDLPRPSLEEALPDIQTPTPRAATPVSIGLISPLLSGASPFSLKSPIGKIEGFYSPWLHESVKDSFGSPMRSRNFSPSLSENRAELMNLMMNQ